MYPEIVETFQPDSGPTGQETRTGKTMSKSLITLLLGLFLAGAAWPQEDTSGGDVEEPETTDTAEIDEAAETEEADDIVGPDIVDPDFDDAELDEQTYEEDEDDFVPSEEIPADEPIPFPSNI
jgi:hypothetical protein